MKISSIRPSISLISLTILVSFFMIFFTGCSGMNDPFGGPSYGSPGYGSPYPPAYRSGWEYEQQRQLDHERWRTEQERRRLEDERRRLQERNNQWRPQPSRPAPARESCPNGYTPSEQKCSAAERKKGCKDMRLPGGLGCVRRSFR